MADVSQALTLILTAQPGGLDAGAIASALRAAEEVLGFAPSDRRWLRADTAYSAHFKRSKPMAIVGCRERLRLLLAPLPVDINLLASDVASPKRLLACDMDSTLIEQEIIDELSDEAGERDAISRITKAAMEGEIDFETSLRARVARLKGLDEAAMARVAARVTLMPGAHHLVQRMRDHGAVTVLITSGFSIFAEPIGRRLGFREVRANCLEIEHGRITGEISGPILGAAEKQRLLVQTARRFGLELHETMAVGDGANDREMLAAAGLGVAFRAKPAVTAAALSRDEGGAIEHGDLTALLALQGFCE